MENSSNQKRSFKERIFSIVPPVSLIGIVVGALGGYIYYSEIGCVSGTCAITSNPYMSVLWGAVMGYLVGDMFRKKPKPIVKSEE
ncbi:MAG: DUF6132 family protein [Bacteroidales bacterium]|nr:DUF6132 family protein [Bacteroidales bacterium]